MSAVTHARTSHARVSPARTAPRGSATPLPSARPQRPRLSLVDAAPRPHRTVLFGLLCLGLVLAGLASALILNTQRAEASFVLTDLRSEAVILHDERVTLEAELAQYRAPQALADRARDLGMVASPSTAVLRLSDGAVLGVAAAMVDGQVRTVVTTGPEAADPEGAPGTEASSSETGN